LPSVKSSPSYRPFSAYKTGFQILNQAIIMRHGDFVEKGRSSLPHEYQKGESFEKAAI